jgi:hypothetical protein
MNKKAEEEKGGKRQVEGEKEQEEKGGEKVGIDVDDQRG